MKYINHVSVGSCRSVCPSVRRSFHDWQSFSWKRDILPLGNPNVLDRIHNSSLGLLSWTTLNRSTPSQSISVRSVLILMLTRNIYLGTSGSVLPLSFRAENLHEFQNKRISAFSFHYIHITVEFDIHSALWGAPNQTILSSSLTSSKTPCIKRSAKTRIRNTEFFDI